MIRIADLSSRARICPGCDQKKPPGEFKAKFVGYSSLGTAFGRRVGKCASCRVILRRAHAQVTKARNNGTLVPEPCEVCGDPSAQGHHEDYNSPLEVRWLCSRHHQGYHGQKRLKFHLLDQYVEEARAREQDVAE